MFKCCGIYKPDPLNTPDRGTLNVRTESPEILLVLSPMRGEIERGFVCFQQLLIKERIHILFTSVIPIFNNYKDIERSRNVLSPRLRSVTYYVRLMNFGITYFLV